MCVRIGKVIQPFADYRGGKSWVKTVVEQRQRVIAHFDLSLHTLEYREGPTYLVWVRRK